tara:strand:+ start:6554 stop:7327 length:774 start_codon:yes stop_codon:yes gene_type:complete
MLFDSLGHATVNGSWLDSQLDASFKSYSSKLKKNKYIGGAVVGLAGINAYKHLDFLDMSKDYDNLYPIAGFDPVNEDISEIENLKKMGFYGIKIHPRFSNVDFLDNRKELVKCFRVCADIDFPIFLCTFYQCKIENYQSTDPHYLITSILKESPTTKVLMVHGGVHDLMKYCDLARFNENILIDLSLVMMKYPSSSIDHDIKFLFNNFDRKISIGSDYPEYGLKEVKDRFEFFSIGISSEKKENIANKNISNFLKLS